MRTTPWGVQLNWLVIVAAMCVFALGPRLPLMDLPQHAGQVQLLKDLLSGTSSWSSVLEINWATPYLTGYLLTLAMSYLVPVDWALWGTLLIGFAIWQSACNAYGRWLGSDPRLQCLHTVSYFGFAWSWGFVTFCLGAGVFVWLIHRAHEASDQQFCRRQAASLVVGICALALTHGLLLLAALTVIALHAGRARLSARVWPMALMLPLVVGCVICMTIAMLSPGFATSEISDAAAWGGWGRRALGVLTWPLTANYDLDMTVAILAMLGCICLSGVGPARSRPGAWVLPTLLAAILIAAPGYAFKTAMLYERFTLLLLPCIAWSLANVHAEEGLSVRILRSAPLPLLCATVLIAKCMDLSSWAQQAQQAEDVIQHIPRQARVLSLLHPLSAKQQAYREDALMYWPAWSQISRGTLVEFNFASYLPQPVRYRQGEAPRVSHLTLTIRPQDFRCSASGESEFDVMVIRADPEKLSQLASGTGCHAREIYRNGNWAAFSLDRHHLHRQQG